MKKLSIIGLFCDGIDVANGQSVKTRIVTEELEKSLGKDQVSRIDTYGWRKNPFNLFIKCIFAVCNSANVMFLTDEGGIKVFPWLLQFANVRRKCKLHYYVVGGWLSGYLDRSTKAVSILQKLDAIYVEIPAMLRELEVRGFSNVVLVNKFRRMTPVKEQELAMNPQPPYKLCYFSRVMKEKGIEECIEAVKRANFQSGFTKFEFDIYGAINEPYKEIFDEMLQHFPSFISYKGIINFQNSRQVLKDYFVMLFPTYYTSEGYPNAIVDAFSAGLPVIATRWKYNADIIREHEDGILIDIHNTDQIVDAIEEIASNPTLYKYMRKNCLARCNEYLPENAIMKVITELR